MFSHSPFKEQGRVFRQASFFAVSWGIWIERINGTFREVERSAEEVWEVVRFMSHYVLWSLDLCVFMSLVLSFWIESFSVARVGLSFYRICLFFLLIWSSIFFHFSQ